MNTTLKLASISAVLAAVFVAALEVPTAESRGPAKLHYDRITAEPDGVAEKAPTQPVRYAEATIVKASTASDAGPAAPNCKAQAWPNITPACIAKDGAAERKPVRTITIERREAANTSTLVRVEAAR